MAENKTYSEKLRNPRWQKKRLEILTRDNFSCKLCEDTQTELQIHHLKYSGDPWEAKNEDLITYCKHCHKLVSDFKEIVSFEKIIKDIIDDDRIAMLVNCFLLDEKNTMLFLYFVNSNEIKHVVSFIDKSEALQILAQMNK